jgi:uncharacterized protein with FMN-binding domain
MTAQRHRKADRIAPLPTSTARTSSVRVRPGSPSIHGTNPIPVRALLAIVGTVLGLALLLSFRTPDALPITGAGRGSAAVAPAPTRPATPGGGIVAGAGGPTPTAAPATTGAAAVTPAPARGTGARATAIPAPTVAPTATPAPTHASGSADVTGPAEDTPFGVVQVEVKVSGGKIVDVIPIQLPNDRRRSAQISQYVGPILRDEALQAQSAQIDLISGATWTSGGFQASLQGALDKIASG